MFVLNSEITIGNFSFRGVHGVRITRSLHSVEDTAVIKIPAIASMIKDGRNYGERLVTGNQFKEGDPVVILLGYNGEMKEEFRGFVKRRNLNMPLEVECEGYSWLLRRNKVSCSEESLTLKGYLLKAVAGLGAGYHIAVHCTLDCMLNNVQENGNGLDVLNHIAKYTDGAVSCFFIEPSVLWCGLIYTPYGHGNDVLKVGKVQYRLGYNTPKANTLKERVKTDDPVAVKYSKKLASGTKLAGISDVFKKYTRTHSRLLNQIKSAATLKLLANEKACRINYDGYEGSITTFLQPFAQPGYRAYIADARYPERDGDYLVESVATTYGINGAKRAVEIGVRIGFLE